jgi:hypothetical protein
MGPHSRGVGYLKEEKTSISKNGHPRGWKPNPKKEPLKRYTIDLTPSTLKIIKLKDIWIALFIISQPVSGLGLL